MGMFVPQDYEDGSTSAITTLIPAASETNSPKQSLTAFEPWLHIFPHNMAAPLLRVELPPPGIRLRTTAQLAYCNNLLRTPLSLCLDAASIFHSLDPSQQASVNALLQDKEEQDRVRGLTIRVIEEFAADALKTSDKISEVILLGPFLVQEHYRRLLNCFIAEFETSTLLDIELLQGLVQLVECAKVDYLQPDDLIRILAVLRIRFQNTRQETTKHPYCLTQVLARLLDVMVEGKVQDLRLIVDQEPLFALLGQLVESTDPYLKHQAAYALQGLLHIPNDETHRQFVLRHVGNIAMGLLGVASICKLDFSGLTEGAVKLYKTTGDSLETGSKVISGIKSIHESGQDILSGRRVWYTALREAQEHTRKGRLSDFNQLIFEAPCRQDIEFQWGVCQLLEKIAVDPHWDGATHQHAVDLLANLYRDDADWTSDDEVLRWILTIIGHIASLPDLAISNHAQSLLLGLEEEGDDAKQAVYRAAMAGSSSYNSLQVCLPMPTSSPLLARALAIHSVEGDLHRLRVQRLKERENTLYIPPQAKPTLQSSDDTLFPLMEKSLEFLESHRQVLLLLGDSGAGKSTFSLQLEHTLWKEYKRGSYIPLYINLPTIDNPEQDLIAKELRYQNFSEDQIQDLKLHRQFIVICDGYDESQLKTNLHTTNQFNQPGQWNTKMVVSCRSQYLGQDYRSRFQPQSTNHYTHAIPDLMLEAVIAPFSRVQIGQYVEQYVKALSVHNAPQDRPAWTKDEYMERLTKIPKLIELVSNPFLLTLALEALPEVVGSRKDLSAIRISRVQLYDGFVNNWLEVNKRRLESSTLSEDERLAFDLILEDDFLYHGIQFQKDLAAAIYEKQGGQRVIKYIHLHDSSTWKSSFFSSTDAHTKLLRESSTVTRSGSFFRFIHQSLLEYFYSRTVYDPVDYKPDVSSENHRCAPDPKVIFSERNFINEPAVLQFLAERVDSDALYKSQLLAAVEDSKANKQGGQAGATSISILVRAGVRFNGADLQGIRIPGADLSGGQFDSANLERADMSKVDMTKTWLRQANLRDAQVTGVQFGELPHLVLEKNRIARIVFSSDGEILAVSTEGQIIVIFDAATWNIISAHLGGEAMDISPTTRELAKTNRDNIVEMCDILTGETRLALTGHDEKVTDISFSADGKQIATSSKDTTIRIWSTLSGATLHILRGHSEAINGVAFSPTGLQLASCSNDRSVRTWYAESGELLNILTGHTDPVQCVAYSRNGSQIATGDRNNAAALWNAHSGELLHGLSSQVGVIASVVFSLDGQQVASGGEDGTVRLWDVSTGECISILSGHLIGVNSVAYSPTGGYMASGSVDGTVRLWKVERALLNAESGVNSNAWNHVEMSSDGEWVVTSNSDGGAAQLWETQTGKLGLSLVGYMEAINELEFSPCGQQIVSAGDDKAVRLWCTRTGVCLQVFEGHTERVFGVAFSPCGGQVVSTSADRTLRIWDTKMGTPGRILEGHTETIRGATYSPCGLQIASCSDDKTVRLWDARTGKQLFVVEHSAEVDRLMFSPCGKELVSVSMSYCELRCWNPRTGERLERLDQKATSYGVFCCCYSPIGQQLIVTAGTDGMMRVWDRSLGGHWLEVFQTMIGIIFRIQWRQSSSGDQYLVTLGVGAVRIWRLVEGENEYNLRLVWGLGKEELSLENANLKGSVGLSPVDLKLAKQRGANLDMDDGV
jgi:WD40 repeat protein